MCPLRTLSRLPERMFLLLVSLFPVVSVAQSVEHGDTFVLSLPFDFPPLLSGNFGELRANHFHAGIDFKTQGVVGKPIHAPADGYISRATVSPGGYGRAIYVTHRDGFVTVYGHLERFPSGVAERVRARQYEKETFAVDMEFSPGEFPIEQGQVLAIAGNSGYSFGPHLHFEVRAFGGRELVNPMRFYASRIKDTKPPMAYSVAVNPYPGRGLVNGSVKSVARRFTGTMLRDTLTVWGTVGFAIEAEDFMDDTNNRYGVYSIEMYVDDSLRFSSRMDGYALNETRLINAWADYKRYHDDGDWFLRSYVLENNPLRILHADADRGWLKVDEERPYNVEYRLADYHGNEKRYRFSVVGVRDSIPMQADSCTHYLYWYLNNEIAYGGMRLCIPGGELFENAILNVNEQPSTCGVSPRYNLGGTAYPLWRRASLHICADSLPGVSSEKYYIKQIGRKGSWSVGGDYRNGCVSAYISLPGIYEAAVDTVPPYIRPLNEKRWRRNGRLLFAVGDKATGVKDFRGTIDGRFVLFEYSSKNARISCDLKSEGIKRGRHSVVLTVTDHAGNKQVFEKTITY